MTTTRRNRRKGTVTLHRRTHLTTRPITRTRTSRNTEKSYHRSSPRSHSSLASTTAVYATHPLTVDAPQHRPNLTHTLRSPTHQPGRTLHRTLSTYQRVKVRSQLHRRSARTNP